MQNSTPQTVFTDTLRTNGLRITKAKQAVFDILLQSEKPMSIQQIVNESNKVHFVSVYRAVDSLQKIGILRLIPQGFKNLFELSDLFQEHHHHATCDVCGLSTSIHSQELEDLMKQLSVKSGMKHTNHQFEIHGICSNCSKTEQ